MSRPPVIIEEEIPGHYYRWFVSPTPLDREDPRMRFFYNLDEFGGRGRYNAPKFWHLDDAKVWCADRGLHYRVVPYSLD